LPKTKIGQNLNFLEAKKKQQFRSAAAAAALVAKLMVERSKVV